MSWSEDRFNRELESLQERLGYRFGQPELLVQALTHRSYANEMDGDLPDNERLEFLGDAVLELVVSRRLFDAYPDMPEGQLTRARATMVRAETLADVAMELEINELLRLGRGESATGGRSKRSVLSAAFEAVLGAAYLDGGFEAATALVDRVLVERFDSPRQLVALDPKSRFQEALQERGGPTPRYELRAEEGPDHSKHFVMVVLAGDREMGRGEGPSKKEAAAAAARDALEKLDR